MSTVKRVRECGPTCRITQTCSKLRAIELRIWREEVARVAPEQKDRDTFGGAGAPCLVSHCDVFPSLMQGCHRGSDPEKGGSGSHGAVHSTPPGRSKQSRKQKRSIEGRGVSEAVRSMPQQKARINSQFIRPICLQPAEQLHGRDAVPRTSERIAGKSADTHIGRSRARDAIVAKKKGAGRRARRKSSRGGQWGPRSTGGKPW